MRVLCLLICLVLRFFLELFFSFFLLSKIAYKRFETKKRLTIYLNAKKRFKSKIRTQKEL
ncbi:hypothetical protein HPSAT_07904 (plasmid) [Helicobacter pylori Sat464]|nr:hypothetical protein HPSAT_07899 [Helicobacter pylori Sat464]ADO06264.1 hypothetical protein HPSAT_07904 [Helicobacter pylori Sat464]